MTASLRLKRVYEAAAPEDGQRVLVDRLWPRGVSRQRAALTIWLKEIAPSDDLRHWFDHDPSRWEAFKARYAAELDANPAPVEVLRDLMKTGPVTLLYGAHDEQHNNAVALADHLGEGGVA